MTYTAATAGPSAQDPVTALDHAQGLSDADLVLVLYGDFQCPYTRQAVPGLTAARQALGDRLQVVFRHYPLVDIHPQALHAAEISEVAADAGHFWEMFEVLFSRQHHLGDDDLVRYAEEFGIDDTISEAALRDLPHADRVQRDVDSGSRAGVDGTPAFFLNGHRLSADWHDDGLLFALRDKLPAAH
jgi:protein-disulfide isomerase